MLENFVVVPFLVFHTYGIIMIFDVLPFVSLGFQKNGTGVHIPGQAFFIHHMIQIIFPIQPVFEAFIGKRNTVLRGVVGPYNSAGSGRRALTGIGSFVHAQGFVALFG